MASIEIWALILMFVIVGVLVFFIISVVNHVDSENEKKAILKNKSMEKNIEVNKKEELKLNSKSMWAFCLSILGILGLYLLSFIAVVVSILAIQDINKNKEKSKGMGLAIAGLVIGILGALANIGQRFIN